MKKIALFALCLFVFQITYSQNYHYETRKFAVYPTVTMDGRDFKPQQLKKLLGTSFDYESEPTIDAFKSKGYGLGNSGTRVVVHNPNGGIYGEETIVIADKSEDALMFLLDGNSTISSDDANKLCKTQLEQLRKIYYLMLKHVWYIEKQVMVLESNTNNNNSQNNQQNQGTAIDESNNSSNQVYTDIGLSVSPSTKSAQIQDNFDRLNNSFNTTTNLCSDLREKYPNEFALARSTGKVKKSFKNVANGYEKRKSRNCADGKTAFFRDIYWYGAGVVATFFGLDAALDQEPFDFNFVKEEDNPITDDEWNPNDSGQSRFAKNFRIIPKIGLDQRTKTVTFGIGIGL